MAAGDSKLYRDAVLKLNEGAYAEGDTWTIAFVSDTYATLNADATNPVLANVTPVSGGNGLKEYRRGYRGLNPGELRPTPARRR